MTKKDYQAIARVIYQAQDIVRTTDIKALTPKEYASWMVGQIGARLADILATDNPRFDRARFAEACETGRCKGMRS